MSPKHVRIAGFVLQVLIGAIIIAAGGFKLFGTIPPEAAASMPEGIKNNLKLIGIGEAVAALLMILPRTSPLGTLAVSGFWGGVICSSMIGGESYLAGSILLAATWIGGAMRGSVRLLDSPKPAAATAAE